ncbi:MAG: aminotransferase class I/II-fold pyridoxal phosphate-dependent enzyme [Hallerella porci]|uniref:Aspartate/methionine/tyrosine aminotransferase n=1 Tax=Hallerella porci TaxID=1945871 RepID=A0ABX5LMX2_9BACT|nr:MULTISPECIES: aminotransferase class I/II-fold pyridoxal phosphate-dependent enzyme [Hallerella]MCI5601519.1 aminotransferase class I/II-fold pyridoxal phosphate-dependent enzyme [Hallerella sp.]MDY3921899.1 aminotransferase class I/II-fold pyridoxal phosphate-dependent enzyme [Hallerella porci]PWK96638.1 aspartate/methionine/tyrosine aminotransferase [Hallerella porci]
MNLNPLAAALNADLEANGASILQMLSQKGKNIFFPSKGILGQGAEAKGKEINATIGTALEDDGSPLVLPCVQKSLNLPKTAFLYAPSYGNPDLRDAWKAQILRKNPSLAGKNFSRPVVSAALTHAISVAGYLFLDPGDKVIIPDLYWDNYELVFENAYGAKIETYNTFKNGGFDIDALEAALEKDGIGKKVLLLNFPNNPTGYTATEEEAKKITEVLVRAAEKGNKVVALLDDAYFGLVYEDGVTRESLFTKLVDAHKNLLAVKLDGPTKEDYVWGFRVGFISFGFKGATAEQLKALESKAAGAVRGNISNAPSISQKILLAAYQSPEYVQEKEAKYAVLKKRYDIIKETLASHPEYKEAFEPMPFNSGYFMCVKPKGVDAEAVREELLKNYSTGTIMLKGLLRLAFSAVPTSKLPQLFDNVYRAVLALTK